MKCADYGELQRHHCPLKWKCNAGVTKLDYQNTKEPDSNEIRKRCLLRLWT